MRRRVLGGVGAGVEDGGHCPREYVRIFLPLCYASDERDDAVAQMSTKRKWTDVRLLSFDLQTVEFAYAGDYTVSITCTDQLAPGGGTYDLRFSRATEEAAAADPASDDVDAVLAQYNPHEDVEAFMQSLLRQGPLSVSLARLVAMLRDTLPIVAELERIRVTAEKAGQNIDTFAKTAGWFRVLYGDHR